MITESVSSPMSDITYTNWCVVEFVELEHTVSGYPQGTLFLLPSKCAIINTACVYWWSLNGHCGLVVSLKQKPLHFLSLHGYC